MQFELSGALLEDILFSMEDQGGNFMIDAREGVVLAGNRDSLPDPDRYIPLPRWDSSDGYRLMERFAAGFKNPLLREELSAALNQGKGVFRAFKDVLTAHPETERRWFSFKQREMKRGVLLWYNALREEWGLERIGGEPEETDDLLFEDFRFREPEEKDSVMAAELHRQCMEDEPDFRYGGENGGTIALVAETGGGDFAAYISARREGGILGITALEVRPEYRGLGIGEALLTRFCGGIDRHSVSAVVLDLPAGLEGFSRVLLRNLFKPRMIRYALTLETDG